jgi:hypothetical protein
MKSFALPLQAKLGRINMIGQMENKLFADLRALEKTYLCMSFHCILASITPPFLFFRVSEHGQNICDGFLALCIRFYQWTAEAAIFRNSNCLKLNFKSSKVTTCRPANGWLNSSFCLCRT